MDMCDACTDRQQWLLDNNDGSQVLCTCEIEENSQVGDDGKVATTIDVGVQTSETADRQQSLFKADAIKSKAECENCGHKFSRPDGLKRHQNYSCKIPYLSLV